jgi:putative FmdB family regulatory protein
MALIVPYANGDPRATLIDMPAYDYRCTVCGREMELIHRMSETITHQPHASLATDEPCDGAIERLISAVGVASSVGTKPPSDNKLQSLGFTKYVRGAKGYEKAFGSSDTPSFIDRE